MLWVIKTKGDVKLRKLVDILKKKFDILKEREFKIENVKMDSGKIEKDDMFIAINKGNEYIGDALKKGASLVIGDKISEKFFSDERVISVKDSVLFMQELAREYRETLNVKVIAVTGSEGKTTTKDLIYSVLQSKFKGIKTLGNYNNQIGMPYMVLQIKENDEIAVLELGMSELGEIENLARIAKPDYGVITNIGDSHLEYLINRDNVFKAKTELFKYVSSENRVVFGDDPYFKKIDALKLGLKKENDYILEILNREVNFTEFKLNDKTYKVPLNGDYNCINASFAVIIGEKLGMSYGEIYNSLKNSKITGMRFEKIEKDKILYINDAYNASPVSMKNALEAFNKFPTSKKKIVVLADALELGKNEIEYHKEVLEYALERFDTIFLYGERMRKASEILKDSKITVFNNKSEIKNKIIKLGEVAVLLKGSRGMKLEEVIGE